LTDIHIQTYIVIVAFIIGCLAFKYLTKVEKGIILILGLNVICDLITSFLAEKNQNTHVYYSILTLAEGLIVIFMYLKSLNSKFLIFSLALVIPSLLLFGIYNILFIQGLWTLNTYTFAPLGLMIMVFSYIMIRKFIGTHAFSINNLMLWFAVACFIYYGIGVLNICLFIWAQHNMIAYAAYLLNFNNVLYSIYSFLLIIGFIYKIKINKI